MSLNFKRTWVQVTSLNLRCLSVCLLPLAVDLQVVMMAHVICDYRLNLKTNTAQLITAFPQRNQIYRNSQ